MLTDIEIAQQTKLRPIAEIAEELHICPEELEPYGRFKAKLNDDLFKRLENEPDGKWAHYLQRLIRECDPYLLKTFLTNAAYEGGFRGFQQAQKTPKSMAATFPGLS